MSDAARLPELPVPLRHMGGGPQAMIAVVNDPIPTTEVEARIKAEAHLASKQSRLELLIVDSEEFPVGWVFYYDSKKHQETGATRDAIAGNAPILVDRRDGSVHFTGTGRPIEEYIERYERRDPTDERSWHP